MRFILTCCLIAFFYLHASAQTDNKDKTILQIDSFKVPVEDFLYLYNKNYQDDENAYTNQSLREYFDLFLNFKLKVFEAKKQSYHLNNTFIKEFETYRKQLAAPYLTDTNVTEQLVQEAYDRLQQEIKAAHILIRVDQYASPEDTLAAYNNTLDLRKQVLDGADFNELAKEFSEDPSAKQNGGDLGYFTALQMVYPFENAAYKTPIGEISMPVRTRFGYHIVMVKDKRPARGEVTVAHIMIRNKAEASEAFEKASEIYSKLKAGEDWDVLCRQFSEDPATKEKGGALRPFTSGMMVEPFADAAFALKNPGDISEPVQTPYGWHIIKLISKKKPGSFEEMQAEIKKKIEKDIRNEVPKNNFIDKLKEENNFKDFPKTKAKVFASIDKSLLSGNWKYDSTSTLLNQSLFQLNDKDDVTTADFFKYIISKQRQQNSLNLDSYLNLLYQDFTEAKIVELEEKNLANKYPEFRNLEKEYYEGLLLFAIMEKEVWNKAVEDTTGLRTYFEQNRSNYLWDERIETVVLDAASEEALKAASAEYETGLFNVDVPTKDIALKFGEIHWGDSITKEVDKILKRLKQDTSLLVKLECGYVKKEKSEMASVRLEKLKVFLTAKGLDSARIISATTAKQKLKQETGLGGHMLISFYSTDPEKLEAKFNKENPLQLQIEKHTYEKGKDNIPENIKWEKGTYTYQEDNRFYKVYVNNIIPKSPKKLDENRGQVISDYQNFLEKQWLDSLKAKYTIEVNNTLLDKLAEKKN
ncbi:peptidylprolyl isomerase [Chondrinema litorale]|uniref:peptidylprolyl isomerase n=1 Tax=Chondrinema litorale TaxID=2994555 RepID=UPI002543B2CF|nr:peptidylprolyl isomerase [Chondrinema litorale]UZR92818.1 peptidylprolyl isomerase [Chondrinema litorale]